MPPINPEGLELTETVVKINRVSKVVKGGKRFHFSALVVSGDGAGIVGHGLGKAHEVPEAIRKASEHAKKNLLSISLVNGTIPHEITGKYGAGKVLLKPAPPGTGVIAGGAVRAICEAAGIRNILTKSLGSSNAVNIVKACMQGLTMLRNLERSMALRSSSVS